MATGGKKPKQPNLDTQSPTQATETIEICGIAVPAALRDVIYENWPERTPTGYDDRSFAAACANHVLLVAREHGIVA
jgi:hypothetical protein